MATQPDFRPTRCVRHRYRYSECRRCADACPHEAVELSDEGVKISDAACQNCALCATACPTEALSASNAPLLEMLKGALRLKQVTFGCAPSGMEGDEIAPCLGVLDGATLALLASRGVSVKLSGAQHCARCAHGSRGGRMLTRNLEAAGALRASVGDGAWADITVRDGSDAERAEIGHDAARRHLFRRFLGRRADDMARAISSDEPQPVPLKAVRFAAPISVAGRELLQILLEGAPENATLPYHEALFAARVEIARGCTACEVCARACPTGAMQIRESGVGWQLAFQMSRCIGCGVCVEACQPQALRFAETLGARGAAKTPVTLHRLAKQRCGRCDRLFISSDPAEICPICHGDDADFSSIFG